METYIQILNDNVINLIVATSGSIFDPTYTWVELTSGLTCTDGTPIQAGCSYDGTYFYSNIPTPTLSVAIANNLALFQIAVQQFVESRYSEFVRLNFIGIYINANINNLTNRMAYIAPLLTWQNTVYGYISSYTTTVSEMTSVPDVLASMWDFSSLISSDPLLTPLQALLIND